MSTETIIGGAGSSNIEPGNPGAFIEGTGV